MEEGNPHAVEQGGEASGGDKGVSGMIRKVFGYRVWKAKAGRETPRYRRSEVGRSDIRAPVLHLERRVSPDHPENVFSFCLFPLSFLLSLFIWRTRRESRH